MLTLSTWNTFPCSWLSSSCCSPAQLTQGLQNQWVRTGEKSIPYNDWNKLLSLKVRRKHLGDIYCQLQASLDFYMWNESVFHRPHSHTFSFSPWIWWRGKHRFILPVWPKPSALEQGPVPRLCVTLCHFCRFALDGAFCLCHTFE